jgi:histidine triad (HIT) family protein
MAKTIFSKIIAGEIPCYKVYEDAKVIAFLDVNPSSKGHTLVVPKEQVQSLDQLSDESGAAVGRVLPRIARAVLKATGATQFNVLQNNGEQAYQGVLHVHFHIIPKYPDGSGLGVRWDHGKLGEQQGKELAATISAAL